jgi:flagellar basal body rod protein FlgG
MKAGDDMPLQGIVDTARTLSFYTRLQQVVANNLANSNTEAFKAERMTARLLQETGSPVPVQETDFQQGVLRHTGRTLDLALEGKGFFVVRTDAGERLTRGGSLRLDRTGQLTDSQGAPLLGEKGPIVLTGGDVEVLSDGAVLLDGTVVDRLRIETVTDLATLMKQGSGRFIPPGSTQSVDEKTVRVEQGSIEEANLDPVLSMVDLVRIQRAYSANVDALKAMDDVLGTISSKVGTV